MRKVSFRAKVPLAHNKAFNFFYICSVASIYSIFLPKRVAPFGNAYRNHHIAPSQASVAVIYFDMISFLFQIVLKHHVRSGQASTPLALAGLFRAQAQINLFCMNAIQN